MMKRLFATTALAAALALPLAQGALAQSDTSVGDKIKPDQMRASKMINSTVYDVQNQKIGDVNDLVLDKDGKVAAVIVGVGGFLGMGEKNVAVKMSDLKLDNNRITLDRTKDQLQQAQAYQLEDKSTGSGTSASPVTGGRAGSGSSSTTTTTTPPAAGGATHPATPPKQ